MSSSSIRKHAYTGPSGNQPAVPEPSFAERARTLMYLGRIGSLSTLSRKQAGFPFGSVMPYGLAEQGRPIFLISTMAMHTQNLQADPRASLLVTQPDASGDPLGASRVTNDAGEGIKHPGFSAQMTKADEIVVVSPEYNHGYSGLLKHVLDSCLKEYIHKAVGIVGVSAGPFGGTRVIENLLPVMRELGLVTIFWDVNFSSVHKVFAEDGRLLDESFIRRIDKFLKELIWMAKTLRHGREHISLD